MRLKVATAIALVGALALLSAPADAATKKKKKQVVYRHGNTVLITRDEDGRTRTRIIIEKRSYLDPGTAALPSDRSTLDYVELPNQHASGVLDNTVAGTNQTALPNQWTLPSRNNPWLAGY